MQEQVDTKAKRARYSFDSLYDMVQYVETAPRTWKYQSAKRNRATPSWDLGAGYDGAMRMAREGWIEGAQRAQEALRAFAPKSPMPDTRVGFYGHMPHVPRYCAGAPDSMLRHTTPPTIGGGRVITLYVNVVANCDQSARAMSNYGLGIAQYVNQLESEGMRVEVHAACVTKSWGSDWRLCHTWRVKGADQPLDLAVMSFAIGHPAMFRRIWFAACERSAMPPSASYHAAARMTKDDAINFPPHAYILNGMDNANQVAPTPEKALEHVEREINNAIEQMEMGVI